MAVPKKRLTSTRSGNRRAHQALKTMPILRCPNCYKSILSHHVCPHCGRYKGEQVMGLENKTTKIKTRVK